MTRVRRQIRKAERELLAFLAGKDQEFRESYLGQLIGITEVEDWGDGTGSFSLSDARGHAVRIYASAKDEDGTPIEITLFASDNTLCVLELLRPDGLPIRRLPHPNELTDVWDSKGNPRPKGW